MKEFVDAWGHDSTAKEYFGGKQNDPEHAANSRRRRLRKASSCVTHFSEWLDHQYADGEHSPLSERHRLSLTGPLRPCYRQVRSKDASRS
jgi:hypothetical protein